jgi:2-aminoethylphosphonate-pyruvate transaminase
MALHAATHVVVAFNAALDQHLAEGGQPARLRRYAKNCETLVAGFELGFKLFLRRRSRRRSS